MQIRKIVLASQSPRRQEILRQLGLEFTVRPSNYEEDMSDQRDPYELAKFLSYNKAKDVAGYYNDEIIIAADTFAIFEGKCIGKPKDAEEAKMILRSLAGKHHKAITGFTIIDTRDGSVISDFGEAIVKVRNLSEEEINEYVATGEPLKMAGAYALLGGGAIILDGVEGDFFSIIGLPITKVYLALKELKAI